MALMFHKLKKKSIKYGNVKDDVFYELKNEVFVFLKYFSQSLLP